MEVGSAANAQIIISKVENVVSDAKKREIILILEANHLTWKCQSRKELLRKMPKLIKTQTKSNGKRKRQLNKMIKTSQPTQDQEIGHVLDAKTSTTHSETAATNVVFLFKNTTITLLTSLQIQSTGIKSSYKLRTCSINHKANCTILIKIIWQDNNLTHRFLHW